MPSREEVFVIGWDTGLGLGRRFTISDWVLVMVMFWIMTYREVIGMIGFKYKIVKVSLWVSDRYKRANKVLRDFSFMDLAMLLWIASLVIIMYFAFNGNGVSDSGLGSGITTTMGDLHEEVTKDGGKDDSNLSPTVVIPTIPVVTTVPTIPAEAGFGVVVDSNESNKSEDNCTTCIVDLTELAEQVKEVTAKDKGSNVLVKEIEAGYSAKNMDRIFETVNTKYGK